MKDFNTIIAEIKIESLTLYLCCRDRRVPFCAKLPAFLAVGLFFSPIDIIPDFIPVLGHLDDIIIIPLLIKLSRKIIPRELFAENMDKATRILDENSPVSIVTAVIIAITWTSVIAVTLLFIVKILA